MKQVVLLITAVLIMFTTSFAQWKIVNQGMVGEINGVYFVSEKTGWAVGFPGVYLKTEDGGLSWQQLGGWQIGNYPSFGHIDFVNDSVGWAVAYDKITKTLDGGISWQTQLDKDRHSFRSIFALNENVAFVWGSITDSNKGVILKTLDGGSTWIDISPEFRYNDIRSLWFFNQDVGIVTGHIPTGYSDEGRILRSYDGGITWHEKLVPELSNIRDVQFINDSTGFFVGRDNLSSKAFLFSI